MSIAGALVFLTLGAATVNIYTQVGLITLIGLISKHGILIVEFANQLQMKGLNQARSGGEGGRHPVTADPHDHRRQPYSVWCRC